MKQSKVNDILLQYEISGVDKGFDINGFSCWVKIKNDIFTYLTKDTIAIGVKKTRFYNLFSVFFYFSNLLCLLKLLLGCRDSVFFHTALSGISSNKDLFTSSLQKKYQSVFYFINIGEVEKVKKNKLFFKKNNVFSDNLFLWPFKFVSSKLLIYFLPKRTKASILNLVNFFESRKIKIPYKLIASSLVTYTVGYYFYCLFFRIVKPRKCYIVSAYSKSEVCAALKKNSILITEIQHGLIGLEHRGYNYHRKAINDVGVVLPTPDKIVVTSDFWRNELVSAGYFDEDEIIIGENYKVSKININCFFNFKYFIFTGQGFDYDLVKVFYKKSLNYLLSNDFVIIYKPHPRESIDEIKYVFSDFKLIHVYEGEESTETLMYHSIGHISFYSSCHFDAVEMKGKTFVLESSLSSIMNRYIATYPEKFILINCLGE